MKRIVTVLLFSIVLLVISEKEGCASTEQFLHGMCVVNYGTWVSIPFFTYKMYGLLSRVS